MGLFWDCKVIKGGIGASINASSFAEIEFFIVIIGMWCFGIVVFEFVWFVWFVWFCWDVRSDLI